MPFTERVADNSSGTRSLLIVGACLWAIAWIAVSQELRQRPLPRDGVQLLLSVVAVALWWSKRLRNDRIIRLTWFGIITVAVMITYWTSGDWWSLVLDAWFAWVMWRYIIDTDDGQIRAVSVHAPGLAGTVEYDSMQFYGIFVEEYSSDCIQQLSQVKTDDGGRFALPHVSDGPIHYLKVSWPGTRTVCLRVEMSADAPPVHVPLKPRKPKKLGNW